MNRVVRVVLLVVAVLAVVALLFLVVFPWVDRTFVTDPVVGATRVALPAGEARPH